MNVTLFSSLWMITLLYHKIYRLQVKSDQLLFYWSLEIFCEILRLKLEILYTFLTAIYVTAFLKTPFAKPVIKLVNFPSLTSEEFRNVLKISFMNIEYLIQVLNKGTHVQIEQ